MSRWHHLFNKTGETVKVRVLNQNVSPAFLSRNKHILQPLLLRVFNQVQLLSPVKLFDGELPAHRLFFRSKLFQKK